MFSFWPIVILLGVMILIHELGHFWAALAVGVKVEVFSLGFGPRLFGFKRNDTDFRLSLVPLAAMCGCWANNPAMRMCGSRLVSGQDALAKGHGNRRWLLI